MDKGKAHEASCLAHYRAEDKSVLDVPGSRPDESFEDWVARSGNPFAENWDVVYQMPFVHNGIRGIADFVVRVEDPITGSVSYEPVDAKLARADAKPGHVLQLCFYADAIESLTGVRPDYMHVWLGSGHVERLRIDDFSPYWRRLRAQLTAALAAGPLTDTTAEPCPHCEFCEFQPSCEQQWRDADALYYVAGIRTIDIDPLVEADVRTLADLALQTSPIDGLKEQRLQRIVQQAALQVQARLRDEPPPFRLVPAGGDPEWGRGFEKLPKPDDGDVFIDFEGHPFWRPDAGLFFLFGLLERADNEWQYRTWWAHSQDDEAAAVAAFVEYLDERRERFPDMHAYHYNHTERSSLVSLSQRYGVAEGTLNVLVETGFFIDLLLVARNSVQVGTESYGLKALERLTDFRRSHEIDKGAGAVLQYEAFMASGDNDELTAIAVYNEDDVRATLALREWLIEQRPDGIDWRTAWIEYEDKHPEYNEQIVQLQQFEPGSDEHFLGDVMGYWRRERSAYITPKVATLQRDSMRLFDDREAITGLECIGLIERTRANGNPIIPLMRFSYPAQDVSGFSPKGGSALFLDPEDKKTCAEIVELNHDTREIDLKWKPELAEAGAIPSSVVLDDFVYAKPKPEALSTFAGDVLNGTTANPVTLALLRRDVPVFAAAGGPRTGRFTDNLDDMMQWVTNLDSGCVGVQGPPGTGKTYSAGHLIHALVLSGKRVGISANTHVAIDNVLKEVFKTFAAFGDTESLRTVRKIQSGAARPFAPLVTYATTTKPCGRANFNLVAGTTWLFASEAMREAPVDVLLIDEAGQLSLADALAASTSARSLVLLGDPLQLPQVALATHPHNSGRSVLEHILGEAVTMPDDRGVFLSETRRMHDDVCVFISDQIYEGKLTPHSDCKRQATVAGTGLRWLRAEHHSCSTYSVEEADLIAGEISRLVGTPWTNFDGVENVLTTDDFMVVAPFNDQVRTISGRLDSSEITRGVLVGTVDKFQGREASVVFYSMTTSSGDDLTRGADFLFSRNRLNVAVSRARCLAYLVCTEALLDTRARHVEDMRLIATLNAFVERAIQLDHAAESAESGARDDR